MILKSYLYLYSFYKYFYKLLKRVLDKKKIRRKINIIIKIKALLLLIINLYILTSLYYFLKKSI